MATDNLVEISALGYLCLIYMYKIDTYIFTV